MDESSTRVVGCCGVWAMIDRQAVYRRGRSRAVCGCMLSGYDIIFMMMIDW